jgi:integrase
MKTSPIWSYVTGEKGETRVRAYARPDKRGALYLEWVELSSTGQRRKARKALGHSDTAKAKEQADALALAFRRNEPPPQKELTLGSLLDDYLKEVTPAKGESKREHDQRAAEMFGRYFGRGRKPATLSKRDWDRFITDRASGKIGPKGATAGAAVGNRVIQYDLKFMVAVLNWATLAGDGEGRYLLDRNPWRGLAVPAEESPRRVIMNSDELAAMRKAAAGMNPDFDAALVLVYETGHRLASIRALTWPDVDFPGRSILWRGVGDKMGFEHRTQVSDAAIAALAALRLRRPGDGLVFPSPENASEPRSRSTFLKWWAWAEDKAGLPPVKGRGWHSLRRAFATELKATPLVDLAALGGWKSTATLLACYQQPDEATQRRALEQRRPLRKAGLG